MSYELRNSTLGELQADLDAWVEQYNAERTHQGRNMEGRTPYDAFKAGLPKADKPGKKEANKVA